MYIPKTLGLPPAAQPDECLSSYLLRLAHRHGVLPHTLCRHVWPDYEFWTRDIDRCANPSLIQSIAARTGLAATRIESMTLRPLIAAMTGEIRRHGMSRWIVPLGVYHRLRRDYGQRYCPACLKQKVRYVRRAWRVAYVNACDIHQCRLQDACPECDHPFIPHRHDSLLTVLCHHCGADVSRASVQPQNRQGLAFQLHMQRLLESGSSPQDEFDGWHELASVLARIDPRFSRLAGHWLLWRQSDRSDLLEYAYSFHESWPQSFVDWAANYRISQAYLKDFPCGSRWFGSATVLLPDRYQSVRKRRPRPVQPVRRRLGRSASAVKMENAERLLTVAFKRLRQRKDKGAPAL